MYYTGLIKSYQDFFKSKDHAVIDSAPLIPEHDPTVLFTTAGMHPLVPFLMGQKHPLGKRIANVQKCIRTGDIDSVGNKTHHTFFLMLGNWSFGDYFKSEAIEFSFEYLTKVLELPLDRLGFTCYGGDKRVPEVPKDVEAFEKWKSLGVSEDLIAYLEGGALESEDNWWGPAGETGPCGPCTEMFYWVGSDVPSKFDPLDKRWVEIWNDVFMQYNKTKGGKFEELKQKNVDTGMGVERTLAVLQGLDDNYLTEMFLPIIKKIEEITGKSYKDNKRLMRIIADHIRACVFILGDERGVVPSNVDQGYILRRMIRRSIRNLRNLGLDILKEDFTVKIAKVVIGMYDDLFPELKEKKFFILDELMKEERQFEKTLEKGLRKFEEMCSDNIIDAKESFLLFQSYGFPIEMIQELAVERKVKVDVEGFHKEFSKHQEVSRAGAEKRFKSGLGDFSVETTRLHTATHLLNEALRRVLKADIRQKGSNITPERLRFDFNFNRKLTKEELDKVEAEVNRVIKLGLEVKREEMSLEEAFKSGAHGEFGAKYPSKVSVYSIGDYSKEICTGPHVKNVSELGHFKIKKEQSSSAGVRRIKGVLE